MSRERRVTRKLNEAIPHKQIEPAKRRRHTFYFLSRSQIRFSQMINDRGRSLSLRQGQSSSERRSAAICASEVGFDRAGRSLADAAKGSSASARRRELTLSAD